MSDSNRINHQTETGLSNSIYGSMDPNYQFLMRLSELSSKYQAGNLSTGYSNFVQTPITTLSPVLTNMANNEFINNFNWATALQYTPFLNGTLNNFDSHIWNPVANSDQTWKTLQSLNQDFYNPVTNNQIGTNNSFQTPVNLHSYPHCDTQESFNDVLAKLGHGLNAAKKRVEEGLPVLIKDPIIQSSIGYKKYDLSNDQSSTVTRTYNPNNTDLSYHNPLSLSHSYYSNSHDTEFSRNSSPVFNRSSSLNQGRGRGRPPKSTFSRSLPSTMDLKRDSLNHSKVFEKPSPVYGNNTALTMIGDTASNNSLACNISSIIKSNSMISSHVSSKLVIPPTIASVTKTKLNTEGSDTESKTSVHTIRKFNEEPNQKCHSKKTSSTSSIECIIDDVLKSFQGVPNQSYISPSPSHISSSSKTLSEVPNIEGLANGNRRQTKHLSTNDKKARTGEQSTHNYYSKPLNHGWTRKTYLKSLTELVGDVEYESPSGVKANSLVVINDVLIKDKISTLTMKHFSFDITLRLGDYLKPSVNHIMGFEKLSMAEVELLFRRMMNIEVLSPSVIMEGDKNRYQRKLNRKSTKNYLKIDKDVIKLKKEQRLIEANISKELKKPIEDLRLMNSNSLPNFDEIQGNRLSKKSFSDCLLVSEFLYSFAEVLGIDAETIPTMDDFQKAFVDHNSDSLHIISWLLMHLLKLAVCDPGITNVKFISQVIGIKFVDLEVNINTLTGVLRAFILSRAVGTESEMESWLLDKEYHDLTGEQQASILGFVVNEMLASKLISSEVDKILDKQSLTRRDKWILDGKLRRLKLIQSRKLCFSNGTGTIPIDNGNESVRITTYPDCSMSVIEADSEVCSTDSNENMTDSQMNWSGEEDETPNSSSLEDIDKNIDKIKNQVFQKKLDLNNCDRRLRGTFLGQDRYHRNYYLLRHLGAIYVDAAPDSLSVMFDTDNIAERINHLNDDKQEKMMNVDGKASLPQLTNDNGFTSSADSDIPNLNQQLEPLDLRLSSNACDPRYVLRQTESKYQVDKHEINMKSTKSDWDIDIIDGATTLYASRAQHIYPEINFDQLKNYYGQQLKDYLKDCNHGNCMEHLKSWTCFYRTLLKHERTESEVVPSTNLRIEACNKPDKIKESADKELERIGKQSISMIQTIPENIKKNWHWIRNEETLRNLINGLHRRGFRERNLLKTIERYYDIIMSTFKKEVSMVFNYNCQQCPTQLKVRSKNGNGRGHSHHEQPTTKSSWSLSVANQMKFETSHEYGDTFVAEVATLEKVEDLISAVVSASLFKKGWKYPERVVSDDTIKLIPSNVPKQFHFEIYPLDLGKERLLELENQMERRYLLPPLNWEFKAKLGRNSKDNNLQKTLDEVVSLSCGFEDVADSSSSLLDDNRSLSSVPNQTVPDLEGKYDPRSKSEIGDLTETPPGLVTWRESVTGSTNDQHLLSCIRTLSNAIAWDKSIMKVLCQICCRDCNEAQLLLCDSCDQGYHTYCFRPPMACIPDGQWFCHDCVSKATDQKHCYVCGQPKTARTMICITCKRMLHASCSKPMVTRVPRKWTCHNCAGKLCCDETSESMKMNNIPTSMVSLNNYVESNSCQDSNSSTINSDINLLCKPSSNSSISSNNILTKKRSCKRALEPQLTPLMAKKRRRRCSVESGQSVSVPVDDNETPSAIDDNTSITELFEADTLRSMVADLSTVPPDAGISQADFDFYRHFLLEMLDQSFVYPFLSPVDSKKIPIYKKIIRNPMDVGTIARKLSDFKYTNVEDFANDIKLIFTNCEQFNEDHSEVGKAGHALRVYFCQNWNMPLLVAEETEEIVSIAP